MVTADTTIVVCERRAEGDVVRQLPLDQRHAKDHQTAAKQSETIDRVLGKTHPAKMIEQQRRNHLAGDDGRDKGPGAKARRENDNSRDINRA